MYALARRFWWQTGQRTAHELRKIDAAAKPRTKRERNARQDAKHAIRACFPATGACSARECSACHPNTGDQDPIGARLGTCTRQGPPRRAARSTEEHLD